jgi:cellulose synthase/poly-beta-1,6-N-acetylglucosamine synthase-like glycosyltransferase
MQMFCELTLLAATVLILVPVSMFCLEVVVSLWPRRSPSAVDASVSLRVAVLIPAHNEESGIAHTLTTLMPTLPNQARVLVIADNCTDNTATIAVAHGAEVIERSDARARGKGYALNCGLKALAVDPPEVVVFLDADCQVSSNLVAALAAEAHQTGRPVQGLNLCDPDPNGDAMQAVSALAFRFKNYVRTLGLSRLAGFNYLTGTGMALPWRLASTHSISGTNVVEDMQWGIDLALAGYRPIFLPEASVRSPLPQLRRAATTQRTRWEHGHLKTLSTQSPRLVTLAFTHRRLDLLLLAIDLAIPPLSLLVLMLLALQTIATAAALVGLTSWMAPGFLAAGVACLFLAVSAGWWRYCRKVIPAWALISAPFYAASKLPIYARYVYNQQQEWVRTDRDPAPTVVRRPIH